MQSRWFLLSLARKKRKHKKVSRSSLFQSCMTAILGTCGSQSIVCCAAGDRIWRYNPLRDNLCQACRTAILSQILDPTSFKNFLFCPVDILIPNKSCSERPAIDVTLTSSLKSPQNQLQLKVEILWNELN